MLQKAQTSWKKRNSVEFWKKGRSFKSTQLILMKQKVYKLLQECSLRIFIWILNFVLKIAKNEQTMTGIKFSETPCTMSI